MKQMIKRIGVLCMTAVLALALLPINAFASEAQAAVPDGTKEKPYSIAKVEDFDLVRQNPTKSFVLANDIDMKGESFAPIAEPFLGSLDGKGYKITNLKIDNPTAALFLNVAQEKAENGETQAGELKNIVFVKPTVTGNSMAAVVAAQNAGYLTNIHVVEGSVSCGTKAAPEGVAGGLVAMQLNGGSIKQSGSTAAVTAAVAGGLVGDLEAGKVTTSYAGGTVTGGADKRVGAVFGSTENPAFTLTDVFYNNADGTAVVGTLRKTDESTKKDTIAPYTGEQSKNAIGITPSLAKTLEQGAKDELPITYTADPVKSVLSYTSSDATVLKVNKDGSYEAVAAGKANYILKIACGDYPYTIAQAVEVTAAPKDGAADSTEAPKVDSGSTATGSDSTSTSSDSTAASSDSTAASSDSTAASSDSTAASSDSTAASSDSTATGGSDSTATGGDSATTGEDKPPVDSGTSTPEENPEQSPEEETPGEKPDTGDPAQLPEEIKNGSWNKKDGKIYYILADGKNAVGPQVIEDVHYIFDETGVVQCYKFFYNDAWYLADETGALYRNCFVKSKSSRSYYNLEGAATKGTIKGPDGKEYYQRVNESGNYVLATGVATTDDMKTYLFDADGARVTGTGWVDGVYVEDGLVPEGKRPLPDGKTYIFKQDGTPYTGDFTYGGVAYCADETGALYLDAFRKMPDGTLRYYNAEGKLQTGWIDRSDGRYYQTGEFVVLTGRQAVGSVVYFFGSDGKLSTTDGWAGDYYVRKGEALTGMQNIDGKTYYFGADGLVVRGVFTLDNAKYCGDETGALYKEALAYEANGTGAYYGTDGKAIQKDWVSIGTDKYYQLSSMVLATGRQVIDGTVYFFTAEGKQLTGDGWAGNYYVQGGKVVTNRQITINDAEGNPQQYVFSSEGAVYKNEFTWNGGTYCADAAGKLYTDTVRTVSNGVLRYFGKDGKAPIGEIVTENGTYYQSKELALLTGKQTIEGQVYYFSDAGRMITAGWVGNVYVLNGKPAEGPQTIGGKKYIFSSANDKGGAGIPFKYTFKYNGGNYLATSTGVLYTNSFLTTAGKTSYYGVDGVAPLGWFMLSGGAQYYQTEDLNILTGPQKVPSKDGKTEGTYFFGSDGKLKTDDGWAGDYYVVDGAALVGMQTLENKDYYFGNDGLRVRGEITLKEGQYFADENGVLQKDYIRTMDNGTLRYYNTSGIAETKGMFDRDGIEHYQSTDMVLAVGKKVIGNEIYFFESDGKRKTTDGWAGDYYVKDKVAVTGWQTADDIAGGPYMFDAEGAVQKGDFTFDNNTYYGDPKTGAVLCNAVHDTTGGKRYHDAEGKALPGWITLGEDTYYQNADLLLVTGRQVLPVQDGKEGSDETALYFFTVDGKLQTGTGWAGDYYLVDSKVLTGWQEIEGAYYVFNDDGLLQKDNFQYKGAWYCANEKGVLATNTIRTLEDKHMRYFDEKGAAVPGFFEYNDAKYYQNDDVYLATGRQVINEKVYFFDADGKQQEGNGWVDGYYLEDGVPATGKKDIDGKTYIFDDAGLVKKGEFTYNGESYWADEAGALYKDTVRSRTDGTKVYFNELGVAPLNWVDSPTGNRYYQTKTEKGHVLSTGLTSIGTDTYYFNASGKLFAGKSGWYVIDGKQCYLLSDGRYCAPPTITSVATAHDANKKLYSITVNSAVSSAAGTNSAGTFSFDGGLTWQVSNVLTVPESSGITLGAGKIRVRDGIGQVVQYSQTIYLAPVVLIPGSSGASGPGSYGIDVSMYNRAINWQAVKASGINFAIIRATSANNNGYYVDPYFESNVRNAKAAGIDVGLYIYSYARSYQDVADEVNFFVNSQQARNLKASGISLDYPVYVDYEDKLNLNGTDYNQRTDYVRQMMVQLKNAGYYPGFYTYHSYRSYFNVNQLVNEGYDFWYARYPANPYPPSNPSSSIGTNVSIWQYCSDGNTNSAMKPYVNGIYTSLDLNYVYDDVPKRVHTFYGTGSTQTKPNAPEGVVTPDVLTVYDTNTSKVVTDKAANILARIVQTEVGGFNNAEVYKAQAIAAQSYIMFQAQRGATPTVSLSTPSSAVQSAVNEVANKIVTYGGVVANTMYGSANSGKTYSPDGMWSGGYPYLVAGIDSPGDLAATTNTSGGASWQNRTNTISLARMTSNIEKMLPGSTNGRTDYQNWITNPEYDGNGYLTYITVMGSRIKAGKFYDNCWGLYSPNFSMQYNGNGTWNFVTRGNGHCVGMSQWGAYGFANSGWNYTQILNHYYPGTQITNLK